MRVSLVLAAAATGLLGLCFGQAGATPPAPVYGSMAGADLGDGASLNGSIPFPANNAWNTDISKAPVDPNSASLITSIGSTLGLHPDFGAGTWDGSIIGIPYVVVSSAQKPVAIVLGAYKSQSDPGPFRVPPTAPIEGYRPDGKAFGGDRHVLVIDRDTNRLYEMFDAYPRTGGTWKAAAGALFHLNANNVRPTAKPDWTSADAAGLPIFPGLVRYDEASTGVIRHALRFTVGTSRRAYVAPANHFASNETSAYLPPMGMRVRLKASYQIPAGFSKETRAILEALKTYGMIVADNGSSWFISGAPDSRWNNNALVGELATVKGSDFEVVKMGALHTQ